MLTGWFPPLCPECRDGKCRNCTGWTLDAADNEIDCACDHSKDGS